MPLRLISQQVLLEHEILARLSDALRTAIGWSRHSEVCNSLSSIRFLMESFQRHMDHMFELEEHDGYMGLVEKHHSEHQAEIARFRQEHKDLRAQLQGLVASIDASTETVSATLFDDVTSLLDQLDRHNKEESNLLQEVILHGADKP